VIVNMSGEKLPLAPGARVRDWPVRDPIGQQESIYKAVAEQIEGLVMRLIFGTAFFHVIIKKVISSGYGGIGRRAWFRSTFSQGSGGSSPLIRTKQVASFKTSSSGFTMLIFFRYTV
jgi:hypothetical protein